MITATRFHDICCGHRVVGQGGKCEHLHGHNYRVHFVCTGEIDEVGRIVDFSVIKELLCNWLENNWDHRFLVWAQDPWAVKLHQLDDTVLLLPFNPTAENMAVFLTEVIAYKQLANTGVQVIKTIVEETRKCSASYEVKQ